MSTSFGIGGSSEGGSSRQRVGTLALGVLLACVAGLAQPVFAGGPTACFKEGPRPPDAEAVFAEISAARTSGPQAAIVDDRWNVTATNGPTGVTGDPVILTWGIAQDGSSISAPFSDVGEVPGPSVLISTLDAWYGPGNWLPLFQDAFDTWTALTGIEFRYEDDDDSEAIPSGARGVLDVRPDIRIGGHPIDGDGFVVAYAYRPDSGDIVLDTDDPVFYQLSFGNYRNLRNTLMHEIGHTLGLQHVCPVDETKLMEPDIVLTFDGPQHDDLLGVQGLYGDFRENDDAAVEAFDLGIGLGELVDREELSIDGAADEDWIGLPDQPGLYVGVEVQPYGEAYQNGSCTGGGFSFDNTLSNQDLAVEVLAADGTTVLASSDVASAGGVETIAPVPVPGGGFVRVVGDGAADVQIYDMTVEYIPEPGALAATVAGLLTLAALERRRARRRRML